MQFSSRWSSFIFSAPFNAQITLDFHEQNSLLEKLQRCEAASFPNILQTLYIEDKAAGK